ncbi:MAG TPA: S-layer homology domain-containing protein [Chloroflexia bacterium]|nr:S-layer homology domain-containing protein [Chloroflexia bacterium]
MCRLCRHALIGTSRGHGRSIPPIVLILSAALLLATGGAQAQYQRPVPGALPPAPAAPLTRQAGRLLAELRNADGGLNLSTGYAGALDPSGWRMQTGAGHIAPSTVMTNGWTNVFPNLNAVSAVSSSEAWAVGGYGHLIHYTGGAWTVVDPPVLQGVSPSDINMASAALGWAVAEERAFEYDGTNWTEHSAGLGGQGYRVTRVAAVAPNDAWGVSPYNQNASSLLHWDGTSWNPVSIPLTATLFDVALAAPTDGWAVGYYSSGAVLPLVLHYDGTAWTPIPGPPDPSLQSLQGVSVDAPGDAWFFGVIQGGQARPYHDQNGTWSWWNTPDGSFPNVIYAPGSAECWVATRSSILHWDGTSWGVAVAGGWYTGISGAAGQTWAVGLADTVLGRAGNGPWVQQQGGPTMQNLYAVSMLTADDAWAVGGAGTILHFTGGNWRVVTSTLTADLFGVQMLSPAEGYAVGAIGNTTGVIARWDGLAWTPVLTTALPVRGVAMTGSGEGWAVGGDGAYGEIWQAVGGVWTQVPSPTQYPLYNVAFDSPGHGWAIGATSSSNNARRVLLEYVSGAWVDRSSSVSSQVGALYGIALAPGGQTGFIVGRTYLLAGDALLRLANGSWTLDPPTSGDVPYAVALDSGNTAWSVGNAPQARHYDGNTWQVVPLPIGNTYPLGSSWLGGLALVPGSGGWAVGGSGTILRYSAPAPTPSATPTASATATNAPTATTTNSPTSTPTSVPTNAVTPAPSSTPPRTNTPLSTATATNTSTNTPAPTPSACNPGWQVVSSPNPGEGYQLLQSVSAVSPSDIWAVGSDRNIAGMYETRTEHWDGVAWTAVPSPNVGSGRNYLLGVAAHSPTDAWAVGYYDNPSGGSLSLIEHWDGSAWTVVPGANPSSSVFPEGVTALAADDAWLVGTYFGGSYALPLVEHWNGSVWTLVPCPNGGPGNNELLGVAARSPTDIWAVGFYGASGAYQTLAEHWDGSAWTAVPGPDTGRVANWLYGVAPVSASDVWAVGFSSAGGSSSAPLAEHWDGSAWTVVPIPAPGNAGVLYGLAALNAADVWAVGAGSSGTLVLHYSPACGTPLPTATPMLTATRTASPSAPPTSTGIPPTHTPLPPAATSTPTPPAATPTPCALSFTDVHPADYFYTPVLYLACHGVISGYADGRFRPYNNTTRSQMVKIVVLGFALPLSTPAGGAYTFADVPPTFPFFAVIETAAGRGIVNGYGCGGPGEPCDAQHRPYFRPYADVTRGQLAKIDVLGAGWALLNPTTDTFADVAPGTAFYSFVETAVCHGIISGYACGGPGEPCDAQHQPYFRQYNPATRGQIAKIVYLSGTGSGGGCL